MKRTHAWKLAFFNGKYELLKLLRILHPLRDPNGSDSYDHIKSFKWSCFINDSFKFSSIWIFANVHKAAVTDVLNQSYRFNKPNTYLFG